MPIKLYLFSPTRVLELSFLHELFSSLLSSKYVGEQMMYLCLKYINRKNNLKCRSISPTHFATDSDSGIDPPFRK